MTTGQKVFWGFATARDVVARKEDSISQRAADEMAKAIKAEKYWTAAGTFILGSILTPVNGAILLFGDAVSIVHSVVCKEG